MFENLFFDLFVLFVYFDIIFNVIVIGYLLGICMLVYFVVINLDLVVGLVLLDFLYFMFFVMCDELFFDLVIMM